MPFPKKMWQDPRFLLYLYLLYLFKVELINQLEKKIIIYFVAINLVIAFDFRVKKWKKHNSSISVNVEEKD